jgi:hypothetical protein
MDALLSQVQMQRRIHSTGFLFSENLCIQNLVGCAVLKCRTPYQIDRDQAACRYQGQFDSAAVAQLHWQCQGGLTDRSLRLQVPATVAPWRADNAHRGVALDRRS